MLIVLAIHLVAAVAAPWVVGRVGRGAFLGLALVPATALAWAAYVTPQVLAGEALEASVSWVPALGMNLDFRLDALSLVMTLLVSGVGALVLVACAAYFPRRAGGLGRFAGIFLIFAGAMLGLVQSDNTLVLYVFWELTTICSYLLVGHYHERQTARRAAQQSLVVTGTGGLAMLGGFVLLGEMEGGSYRLSELIDSAAQGGLSGSTPVLLVALALVLAGALSKSALVPFHFWLPAAMAAPTPVSAYLHAAAMVKAGVYLVARLAPGFASEETTATLWKALVLGLGLLTLLVGGYRALRQHDLKLVLAFGTVSQLGLLVVLLGHGDRGVALAGLTLLVAHALFKASLFLLVAVVDWSTGTRDLRRLSGLGRRLPVAAGTAALAVASMVGLPPLIGYVAKEAALVQLLELATIADLVTLVAIAVGSALTLAYGLRVWWGAFAVKQAGGGRSLPATVVQRRSRLLMAPPVVLALTGLALGLVPASLEALLDPYTATYPGAPGHLSLWEGWGWPVALTATIVASGAALFAWRGRRARLRESVAPGGFDGVYRFSLRTLEQLASGVTARTQRGSLPFYLSVVLVTLVVAMVGAGVSGGFATGDWAVRAWDSLPQALVAVVVAGTAILVVRARRRLKAVLLLGVVGYGVALIFALHGAPDLALTQVLVETATLVVFVLVLRRLPAYFSNRPLASSRWWRAALGVAVGLTVVVIGVLATGARIHEPVSVDFPDEAYYYGYGQNVVNVTLVDIRAWDTLGELSVLLAAATGVASLLFLRARVGRVDRARDVPKNAGPSMGDVAFPIRHGLLLTAGPHGVPEGSGRDQTWLPAAGAVEPQRRSVIFEIGTRVVFHTLVVFSVFLLVSGHNAPGGGFAAGLVAGIALIVRYLAGGRHELGEAVPLHPGYLLGAGLFLSAGVGAVPLMFGGTVLQSAIVHFTLPVFGEIHLATAMIFDIGVYLVVLGVILDILRSLGSEVDRHGELEGYQAPDVAYDDPDPVAEDAVSAPVESAGGAVGGEPA